MNTLIKAVKELVDHIEEHEVTDGYVKEERTAKFQHLIGNTKKALKDIEERSKRRNSPSSLMTTK